MKAITLTQPWAALVATGEKAVETRSWSTSYRGDIAIHAGKGLKPVGGRSGLIEICNTRPFQKCLHQHGYVTHNHVDFHTEPTSRMEFGAIIAIAELYEVVPTVQIAPSLSENELAFGDYSDGRFAWLLRNVRPLSSSIPAKGALGLWEWRSVE